MREIARLAAGVSALRQVRRLIKDRRMPLTDLKHLAAKQRDRVERIMRRAAELDGRGDEIEARAKQGMDTHDAFLDTVEAQLDGIEEFNREMDHQSGNEPRALRSSSLEPKAVEPPFTPSASLSLSQAGQRSSAPDPHHAAVAGGAPILTSR